jgi:DNA primase
MARIPNEEIERLKKEIPIERLVTGFGVELKRQGKDLFGRCPFHDDKTPSLSVSPETNLWHCLGACNSGGDVIAWVMKTRGVSFRHAVELLREKSPSKAVRQHRTRAIPTQSQPPDSARPHRRGPCPGARSPSAVRMDTTSVTIRAIFAPRAATAIL